MNSFFLFSLLFLTLHLKSQITIDTGFMYDGIERTYRLYIPSIYDPDAAVPLLFNLHGYGSNAIEQEFYGDFRPIADTANFIIVHPNGTFDDNNKQFWNTFGTSSVDDPGFISAVIDTIAASYNVDLNRVYSTGMSNGGFMSYELACFLSDRITAVASVTGSITLQRLSICNHVNPMPVMQIHGTADATVPYNGNLFFASVETVINHWLEHNNCWLVPEIIQIPDIDTTDGCTAEQWIYSGGMKDVSVELFKIINGGHSWPGAPVNINITNMDFSASEEIWRFFRQFSKEELITGYPVEKLNAFVKIFPNPSAGRINLKFSKAGENRVIITDISGRLIQTHFCNCADMQLNIETKGVYFISVIHNNSLDSGKLIIN